TNDIGTLRERIEDLPMSCNECDSTFSSERACDIPGMRRNEPNIVPHMDG
ncbi:MAG: hypothetical protein AVDCRST_MAG93-5005, partial [uncultured Chloroflexia bacterium]